MRRSRHSICHAPRLPLQLAVTLLLILLGAEQVLAQTNNFTIVVPRKNAPQQQITQIVVTLQADTEAAIGFDVTPPGGGGVQSTGNMTPSAAGSNVNLLFAPDLMQVFAPATAGLATNDPRRRNYRLVLTPVSDFNINCQTQMAADETWQVAVTGGAARILSACSVSFDENTAMACEGTMRPIPLAEDVAELGGIVSKAQSCRFGLDAMFVLDRSGSMSSSARPGEAGAPTRMQSLQTAVESFVSTLTTVRTAEADTFGAGAVPSDNVGVVTFNQNSANLGGLGPGPQPFPANAAAITAGVNALTPSGSTSIGDGLLAADGFLTSNDAMRRRVILMMSDGIQNSDQRVGADVAAQRVFTHPGGAADGPDLPNLAKYQIYSVTVGTAASVQPLINQNIALATGGFYLNSEDDADDLPEFFSGLLQNFLETTTWQTLLSGRDSTTAAQPFVANVPVTSTTSSLVFTVTNRGQQGGLCLRVTPPAGGAPFDPRCGPGTITAAVTHVSNGRELGGNWRIEVTPIVVEFAATTSAIPFHLVMLADDLGTGARISSFSETYAAGDPVRIEARLTELGKPITGLAPAQLRVGIASPTQTLGDVLSASTAGTNQPPGDTTDDANAKLQNEVAANPGVLKDTPSSVQMRDDGSGGDRISGDGIYTALVDVETYGHVDLAVTLEGSSPHGGAFRRMRQETVYLRPLPDGAATTVNTQITSTGDTQNLVITFTPTTAFNHRMGPGWANYFWITSPGRPPVKAVDQLNGTYRATLPIGAGGVPDFTIHFIPDSVLIGDSVTAENLPSPLDGQTSFYPPGGALAGWSIGLRAGISKPEGALANTVDSGFAFDVDLERRFSPIFAAQAVFGFNSFGDAGFGDLNVTHLSGNLKAYFPAGAARLFVNGGAGLYWLDPGDTEAGSNFGFGVQFDVAPRISVEGAYNFHVVATDGTATKFSTYQGGVRIRF